MIRKSSHDPREQKLIEHEGLEVDVWTNDHDAFLVSMEEFIRGGRGRWYATGAMWMALGAIVSAEEVPEEDKEEVIEVDSNGKATWRNPFKRHLDYIDEAARASGGERVTGWTGKVS